MIKYKVVKRDRTSCIIKKDFLLKYEKGKTVRSKEGTLGIFVFDRRYQAYSFMKFSCGEELMIIKVLVSGRGRKPPFISIPGSIKSFYKKGIKYWINKLGEKDFARLPDSIRYAPWGTKCYDSVTPLE